MDDFLTLLEDSATLNGLIDKYEPSITNIAMKVLDIWADVVAEDRHYSLLAESRWKQYQAYIAVGFDAEQAMELLLNNNAEFVKRVKAIGKTTNTSKRSTKE